MSHTIRVTVNGKEHEVEVAPRLMLVDLLRDTLGLTGTHVGCNTSQCGACTVHLDGHAVKACTLLAVQTDGHAVTTIEGLAQDGKLHSLQEGFREEHGLQCGFCTPGIIMAAADLLRHERSPGEEAIRHALEGNYCRCTGYHNIVKAIQHAIQAGGDGASSEEAEHMHTGEDQKKTKHLAEAAQYPGEDES